MLCAGPSHRLLRTAERFQVGTVQSCARQLHTSREHHVVLIVTYRMQRHVCRCVSMMSSGVTVLYGHRSAWEMMCSSELHGKSVALLLASTVVTSKQCRPHMQCHMTMVPSHHRHVQAKSAHAYIHVLLTVIMLLCNKHYIAGSDVTLRGRCWE